jgi:hypothetical protein
MRVLPHSFNLAPQLIKKHISVLNHFHIFKSVFTTINKTESPESIAQFLDRISINQSSTINMAPAIPTKIVSNQQTNGQQGMARSKQQPPIQGKIN